MSEQPNSDEILRQTQLQTLTSDLVEFIRLGGDYNDPMFLENLKGTTAICKDEGEHYGLGLVLRAAKILNEKDNEEL